MHPFEYTRATDVGGALTAIASNGHGDRARFIAGGTNLVDLMKESVERPTRLVDVNRLPLTEVSPTPDGGLRIGALVSNAATAYHPEVERRYPLLSKTILAGASAQLRNMATMGGNLLQRTRCYYFYDAATPACNKRNPGSGCGAIGGYNRIHAILGASEQCIATHPSDMCVALAALAATVRVTGPGGERNIAFADFHRLPGDEPQRDTNLRPDEIITAVDLPAKGFAEHNVYLKTRDRSSYAFALVSAAVGLEVEGDVITEARLALGGVAHKPWRNLEAEQMLRGQTATRENFQRMADFVVRDARGQGFNDFKIELSRRVIVRALKQAFDGK